MSRCRLEKTFQELTSWCSCRFQLTGRQDNELSCDEAIPFPCSHKRRFLPVLSAAKSSPSRNHAPVDGARLCSSSFSRGEESRYSSHLHILSILADAAAEREQASARGDRILTFVICDGSDVVEEGALQALENTAIADNC